MKIFLFAAALRKDSYNKKLISVVNEFLKKNQIETDLADFSGFNMPLYDGDIEETSGLPPGALDFKRRLEQADATIISSPEYNFSVPGTLKNLIDWISRARPMPWKKKNILLLSASPSLVGGVRGLWHLRVPLEGCGSFVYPDMFSLASADEAFNENNLLKDAKLNSRLEKLVSEFISTSRALNALH